MKGLLGRLRQVAIFAALGLAAAAPPPLLDDMPLVVEAPKGPGDALAVFYSGDGGWASMDSGVARELARRGVAVVGVNSLRYFAQARSPADAAEDLAEIIRRYGALWGRSQVAVVGYSFGAGAAPTIIQHLDPAVRSHVRLVALVAPLRWGALHFTPSSWIDIPPKGAEPLAPAVAALRPTSVLCIYGQADRAAACASFSTANVHKVAIGGGHHLDGDAKGISNVIAAALG